MINNLISKLPCFKHNFIYDLVALQNPRLCLDIGAAAGSFTKRIKELTSDSTEVIAFEPFEGNHQYFFKNTQSFRNVSLVKKAVSQSAGTASFFVSSVVTGNEAGWEGMPGYSSVGTLKENNKAKNLKELSVETIAIDDLISTHVDFMKVDVQGGELDVLKGSKKTIDTYGVDVLHLEYSGDEGIIEFLNSHDYVIFDTDYLIIPKANSERKVSKGLLMTLNFYDLQVITLSTGRKAYQARMKFLDRAYTAFLQDFKRNYGYIQTDLICVSRKYLDKFIVSLAQYCNSASIRNSPSLFDAHLCISEEDYEDWEHTRFAAKKPNYSYKA
jgi:FkbM family methyltransferase